MWRKDAVSARLGQGGFIRTYRTDGGVGKSPSPRRKPEVQQRKAKGIGRTPMSKGSRREGAGTRLREGK